MVNYLSIDVEDYFHVSAFEAVSPPGSWSARELRVEKNTERILHLLDEYQVKATFFVLGWVAERCPNLVRRIAGDGHEIASHGYGHQRVCHLTQQEFLTDIRRSKLLLEDISGHPVVGYRAPSYSISRHTSWAFDELCAAGYLYDSSIFPIRHDFYGIADWQRFASPAVKMADDQWHPRPAAVNGEKSIMELPISTWRVAGKNLPIAGGGYFRLFPYQLTRFGLKHINVKEQQAFVFYLHPWELDPGQPKMPGAGWKSNLRHYLNLDKTEDRFKRLLTDFNFGTISAGLGLAPGDRSSRTAQLSHHHTPSWSNSAEVTGALRVMPISEK